MTLTLGNRPEQLVVRLVDNADFVCALVTEDGSDWPETAVVSLHLGGQTWPAEVNGDELRWRVDKALTALVLDKADAVLIYVDGSTDLTWATGEVRRHRA